MQTSLMVELSRLDSLAGQMTELVNGIAYGHFFFSYLCEKFLEFLFIHNFSCCFAREDFTTGLPIGKHLRCPFHLVE